MKKISLQFIFLVTILIVFIACDKNLVFDKYQPIPKSGWDNDSLLVFDIPVADTIQNHNLFINVRNDIRYKYSNLWLFIDIIQPGGTTLTDTFEIKLAAPSGKWLGKGFGGVKTCETIYKKNIFFPVSGDYKIEIQQGMRENVLKGITDIGVKLEKQK
ncbi:MAG: gliding motility lipoprotein GldH [Draconibacterium sp.]